MDVGRWMLSGAPAAITEQPASQLVPAGTRAELYVRALGTGPLTFQWRRQGVNLANNARITGARGAVLTIFPFDAADAGSYDVIVTSPCGSVTSEVAALVLPPTCGSADFDCDDDLGTDADLESFFRCLAGNCPPPPCPGNADFNADGDLGTDADLEAFFRVLGGGNC